jgi:hypothetical protein
MVAPVSHLLNQRAVATVKTVTLGAPYNDSVGGCKGGD